MFRILSEEMDCKFCLFQCTILLLASKQLRRKRTNVASKIDLICLLLQHAGWEFSQIIVLNA